MFSRLRSLLEALRGSRSLNQEIDEELRLHWEARTDDLVRRGMVRGTAERQARIELGGAAAHREEMRASHGLRLFDQFRQDFGQAVRTLGRNPAFSLSIVPSDPTVRLDPPPCTLASSSSVPLASTPPSR